MVFKTASGSFAPTSSSALVRQEEGEGAAGRRERGGEGRRQEGQTECFLFLSPPRHIYLITLSSPFTPHIISFPSASICQFKPDGRTCSCPPRSVHAHLHAHLHPLLLLLRLVLFGPIPHSFFILKNLGFRGRRRVLLYITCCLTLSVSTWQTRLYISSCQAGRRLHSDCKFHFLSIRPSTPLPIMNEWMCYNDSLSSYFTPRSVYFLYIFFPPASSFFFPRSLTFTWLIFPHLRLHIASGIADGRAYTQIVLILLFQGHLKTDLKTTRWCRLTQRCSNSSWQPLKLTPRGWLFKRHINYFF